MWSPAAIEFLRELQANNDRAWFKANRRRYDELLLAPAQALADTLYYLGPSHVFRPYSDTRFNPGGPPIKEQVAVAIGPGAAGWYFDLSLDGLLVGCGLNRPAPDQLDRFRSAIDDAATAAAFEQAVGVADAVGLKFPPPELKRAPRGYPSDHPRLDRLRMKDITVYQRFPLAPWLHEPKCDEVVHAQFEAGRPLIDWLGQHIGPSHRSR